VPRASEHERHRRDELAVRLFLQGESYRSIGCDSRVQLSYRGARLAVKRGLAQARDDGELDDLFGPAQRRAQLGDPRAQELVRRLMVLLSGVQVGRRPRRNDADRCRDALDLLSVIGALLSRGDLGTLAGPGPQAVRRRRVMDEVFRLVVPELAD
jgi:hypothetical protein